MKSHVFAASKTAGEGSLDSSSSLSSHLAKVARIVARYFLAGVFLLAAVTKLRTFGEFAATLVAARLFPDQLVPVVGATVIILELAVLGLLLPNPRVRQSALAIAVFLCCTFLAYSAWRWLENIQVPCHCFGTLFTLEPYQSVLLNVVLLLLASSLFNLHDSNPAKEHAVKGGELHKA